MAISEYAAMEKQGQHKLRRDSAEVHEEWKSVLVYLMENKQAWKIRSAGIIAWKDQTSIGGFKEATHDKNVETKK
jgi:hypothetical protein